LTHAFLIICTILKSIHALSFQPTDAIRPSFPSFLYLSLSIVMVSSSKIFPWDGVMGSHFARTWVSSQFFFVHRRLDCSVFSGCTILLCRIRGFPWGLESDRWVDWPLLYIMSYCLGISIVGIWICLIIQSTGFFTIQIQPGHYCLASRICVIPGRSP
jgi:hypothetical protein